MQYPSAASPDIDAFIARWTAREGGAERANYALFLTELCDLIGVARPTPSGADTERNDYVFERAVRFHHDGGPETTGRIDLFIEQPNATCGRRGADRAGNVLMRKCATSSASLPCHAREKTYDRRCENSVVIYHTTMRGIEHGVLGR